MSFLGCTGHLMAGSGLEEVLELVYAKNAVGHMLSGKAVARAIRGNFLVDAALNALLVCSAFEIPLPVNVSVEETIQTEDENRAERTEGRQAPQQSTEEQQDSTTDPQPVHEDLESAAMLYKQLLDDADMAEHVRSADVLHRIAEKLESKRSCMQNQHTAVLWIQYTCMVDIRKFIRVERTGNWKLHLQAIHDMLPYFAAAGHNLYTKSAYIYLQLMEDLQEKHPEVYNSFQDGLHVVRRSDRYWAGLSTDLAIEQVLM